MPVSGTFTWSESNDYLEVVIPLKGVSPKKVDVFTGPTILKVSYSPFLLDLDLYEEIDDEKSRAVLKDGTLKIRLAKKEPQLWGQVCFDGSREEIKQRRQQAYKKREENVQRQMEKAAAKKVDEERMTFRRHMALEEKERQRMDDVKELEKKRAEEAMHKTFLQLRDQKTCLVSPNQDGDDKSILASVEKSDASPPMNILKNSTKPPQDCKEDAPKSDKAVVLDDWEHANYDIPLPREATRATFRNTPRLFKTPSRESTVRQEQEFIIKNRSSLRKNVLLNVGNTDISDVDPVWLNKKGDEFYSQGDFSSAINAYSEAIEADNTMVNTLGNRSACYLHLREAKCCIQDCLDALNMDLSIESQFESVESSGLFQKKTHIRLGMAYSLNAEFDNAMEHFVEAQKLDKNDDVVIQNIGYLKILTEATERKLKADSYFAEGNLDNAIESYTIALSVDTSLVNAQMNRAACHLAMKNSTLCVDDCNAAIQFLSRGTQNNNSKHHDQQIPEENSSLLAAIVSPTPRMRRKWIVTLLCRRAAAKRCGNDLSGALKDVEDAKKIILCDDGIDLDMLEMDIARLKEEVSAAQLVAQG